MNEFLNQCMFLRYWLGFWVLVAPVAAFCFMPFDDEDLRFSRRTTLLIGIVFLVLLSLGETTLLVGNEYRLAGQDDAVIMTAHNLTRCVTMLLCFGAYFFLVRATVMKKLLVYAMGFTGAAFFTVMGTFFSNVTPWTMDEVGIMMQEGSLYFYFVMDLLFIPLIFLFARRTMYPVLKAMDAGMVTRMTAGVALLMTIYGISVAVFIGYRQIMAVPLITAFFCLSFCVFFSFGLFFSIIRQNDRIRRAEAEARQIARQREIDAFSYRRIVENVENARAIRHDFRHHMRQIGEMVSRGDYDRIAAYVESYMAGIEGSPEVRFCENYLVNNLMVYYGNLCREQGIRFQTKIVLKEIEGISDVNMTVVFSNILENAVNACCRAEQSAPFIDVRAMIRGTALVVVMENSCEKDRVSDLAEDLCRGMGLRSVLAVAKHCGGEMRCRSAAGIYITEISLPLSPPAVKS